jgi:non-ribosomal peptide synthetase component F
VLFTPSLLEQVLNTPGLDLQSRLSHLHIVWLNGEVVPTALQARFFAELPKASLVNVYRISECNDVFTLDLADLDPVRSPKYAPLGLPMSNVKIYLLDEQLRPVPRGMTAEIYVGG